MPADFDGCRFDFRIDSKKGLMPARRKGRSSGRNSKGISTSICSTLYACKKCGVLFNTRQSLMEHKMSHRFKWYLPPNTSNLGDATTSSSAIPAAACKSPKNQVTTNDITGTSSILLQMMTSCTSLSVCENSLANGFELSQSSSTKPHSPIQQDVNSITRNTTESQRQSIQQSDSSSTCTSKQCKGRQLNETVERLWKQKLKTILDSDEHPTAANTSPENQEETIVGARDQKLFVRRITAAPGNQPQFYTSLMRLQSVRRREKRHESRRLLNSKKVMNINAINCHSTRLHSQGATKRSLQQVPDIEEVSAITTCIPTLVTTVDSGASNCQYICDFSGCKRIFRELKHLKVHRMQHTNERPLGCHLCSYTCRQRNSLNWHMKSRHGLNKRVTSDGRTVYG